MPDGWVFGRSRLADEGSGAFEVRLDRTATERQVTTAAGKIEEAQKRQGRRLEAPAPLRVPPAPGTFGRRDDFAADRGDPWHLDVDRAFKRADWDMSRVFDGAPAAMRPFAATRSHFGVDQSDPLQGKELDRDAEFVARLQFEVDVFVRFLDFGGRRGDRVGRPQDQDQRDECEPDDDSHCLRPHGRSVMARIRDGAA